jgi:glutamate/tyrosine decarboxylase-like PLP-dependent enzyme
MPEVTVSELEIPLSAWFTGPKSENGERLVETVRWILSDHLYWRRNCYPEDGLVVRFEQRHQQEHWNDLFNDRLFELLAALKGDFPFFSPRYVAHMIAEQTMPGVAGYFAGMLYNPNNVTSEAAPVTVRLELEAADMIAAMIGYRPAASWSHLTSGGTIANAEAIWAARTVRYLPFLVQDVASALDLENPARAMTQAELLSVGPARALAMFSGLFRRASDRWGDADSVKRVTDGLTRSSLNVAENGVSALASHLGSEPVLLVPESYHYCLPKIADLIGIGRRAMLTVPVDERFRMDPNALQALLEGLDREGRHALAVVAVTGTTEEGAVDPVDRIVELRAQREAEGKSTFWLHADAAYGGYLRTMLIPERMDLGESRLEVDLAGRRVSLPLQLPGGETFDALDALAHCDSVTVDPHKLGYVPYPAGAVCFRYREVKTLLRQDAPYIEPEIADPDTETQSDKVGVFILEGSRPGAAAAAVWLSHSTIPLDASGHGRLIRETVRNACELHALLENWGEPGEPGGVRAVTLCPPDCNILCYAFRPLSGGSLEELNRLNRQLFEHFSLLPEQRSQVYTHSFFVSRTVLSPGHYRTETVRPFLDRLGVSPGEYEAQGVVLLRSTLMNPWLSQSREQGRDYLVQLVQELYEVAERLAGEITRT